MIKERAQIAAECVGSLVGVTLRQLLRRFQGAMTAQ
jgi:hypothetical protein